MVRAALLTAWLLLLGAAPALASVGHDNGQGTFGPASDKVVTDAGFILIAGFPLLILILSLIQNALDKRKYRRMAAAKARRARADERGGW
jgi:preprotein translocase subunit SecG